MLNNLEKQTSIPKVYAFLGLVGVYFFLIFFNIAGEFLVNFAGFLIPGYFSLEALFSASKVDDTQVSSGLISAFLETKLTSSTVVDCKPLEMMIYRRRASTDNSKYWVVYAFLNVFESVVNAVYWFRKLNQVRVACYRC